MYCCLNYELQNVPILSEYAHTREGRIDFFVFDKKWGIEIIQCGNASQIRNHIDRFLPGGKYRAWNIIDDYMILNFCPKSQLNIVNFEGNVFHSNKESAHTNAKIYQIQILVLISFKSL